MDTAEEFAEIVTNKLSELNPDDIKAKLEIAINKATLKRALTKALNKADEDAHNEHDDYGFSKNFDGYAEDATEILNPQIWIGYEFDCDLLPNTDRMSITDKIDAIYQTVYDDAYPTARNYWNTWFENLGEE